MPSPMTGLMPILERSSPSKIVNVVSAGMLTQVRPGLLTILGGGTTPHLLVANLTRFRDCGFTEIEDWYLHGP